jgi:hypothetical protein
MDQPPQPQQTQASPAQQPQPSQPSQTNRPLRNKLSHLLDIPSLDPEHKIGLIYLEVRAYLLKTRDITQNFAILPLSYTTAIPTSQLLNLAKHYLNFDHHDYDLAVLIQNGFSKLITQLMQDQDPQATGATSEN